jgi:hypothetical protein
MDMAVTLPLGELLNESSHLRKEIAYGMQTTTPRYRVKKPGEPAPANAVIPRENRLYGAQAAFPPAITARAREDDGQAKPLFVTSWIDNIKCPKTLIDGGSLVELISLRVMNQLPHIPIHTDGHVNIALADDRPSTLTRYAMLPVNVEGVVAKVKAYILPVGAYDLLLGMRYQRRVGMTINLEEGQVTMKGDDHKVRAVPGKLAPNTIQHHLPILEVEEEQDDTEDLLQAIIDGDDSDSGKEDC